jgi:2-polyprenyl-6-methoxyphenol hydroxylase-like FAD-dependent oxidoreductase
MNLNEKRVVVVGAGIGGMATAVLLARAGCAVTLLERAPEIRAVGAAILLQPNGLAVLTGLGIDGPLRSTGYTVDAVVIRGADGSPISEVTVPAFGAGLDHHLVVRRSALHQALHDAVRGEAGVECLLGVTVTTADPGGTVRTDAGEQFAADLVVGCDGVHSVVRDSAFGVRTRASAVYVRGLVPMADPGVPEEYWTPLGLFGGAPVDAATRYFYASATAPVVRDAVQARDLGALRAAWGAQLPASAAVLAAVATFDDLLVTEVVRVDCARWHSGNRVLLGDAAHAMSPTAGQGANSALVDAAVLVAELDAAATTTAALTRYAARRQPAVRRVADQADRLARMAHLRSPLARRLRDGALGVLGRRPGTAERLVRSTQQVDPAALLALVGSLAARR